MNTSISNRFWLITTSPENFQIDRETTGFTVQGLKERHKKTVMKFKPSNKVVYYINRISKFGAIATITSGYYHDDKIKIWTDEDEIWPSRARSKPEIILEEDEFLDIRKLVSDLSFIKNKEYWSLYVRGSIREIPEEDYQLIESEMKKILSRRGEKEKSRELQQVRETILETEEDYNNAIMKLPLESKSLHDRLGEMLEIVGIWMGYNAHTRHRITPQHTRELDVAWLSGKNPEAAIEIQIEGNLDSAITKLEDAKRFNYRKVILVIEEDQIRSLNNTIKFKDIRHWVDAWSIRSVYELYANGQRFFELYDKLKEARYKERTELELI